MNYRWSSSIAEKPRMNFGRLCLNSTFFLRENKHKRGPRDARNFKSQTSDYKFAI